MKTRVLAAVAFLAICLYPPACRAESNDVVRASVDHTIRALMAQDQIHGMAVAITIDGRVRVFNYGTASLQARRPVSNSTLFEIGSVSKTFTATLASYGAVTGTLSLSDKTVKYFPEMRNTDFGKVSLLDLGTHTPGGFPLQVPDDVQNEMQLMQYLKAWHATYPPGTYRTYSNPGIGMLGFITAKSMHRDFTALIDQQLLPALGLHDTFINLPPKEMAYYAEGYTQEDAPIRMKIGMLAPETYGIRTTASDLIRFVQENMGEVKLDQRLQRAITATRTGYFQDGPMTQDLIWEQYAYPVALPSLLQGNSTTMILKATRVKAIVPPQAPRDETWVNKTGSTNGFGTYVAFIPARHIGIVILANKNYPIPDRVSAAYQILQSLVERQRSNIGGEGARGSRTLGAQTNRTDDESDQSQPRRNL